MKKLIIFDMDGVLFNSISLANESIKEMYPEITDEYHKEMMTGNYPEEFNKLKTIYKTKYKNDEEAEAGRILYLKRKSEVSMYSGLKDLLTELHAKGFILVLNTSAFDSNCLPLLERENLTGLFDFLATGNISTSKVQKFKMIEEKYNLKNEDTLFITDTLGDVREANIANVPTVAVTWGAHDRSYFNRESNKNLMGVVDTSEELMYFIMAH